MRWCNSFCESDVSRDRVVALVIQCRVGVGEGDRAILTLHPVDVRDALARMRRRIGALMPETYP